MGMPLLALGLGKAFNLDAGILAGMVLVGSINGGQASNLCTYIARGNVALSVLMTTATTIGAIFMTPLLCKGLLGAVAPVDGVVSTCLIVASAVAQVAEPIMNAGLALQLPVLLLHLIGGLVGYLLPRATGFGEVV